MESNDLKIFQMVAYEKSISSYFSFIEELAIISSIDIKKTDELLQKPIIISNNVDCTFRATLEKWIILNDGTTNRIIEFDSSEAIIKYVEDGMGISLLPKSLVKNNDRVCVHQLPNELNKVTIYFIKRNDSNINHPVNNFINMLSEG
ncbi:HTH-type transcriptional regulator YofA [Clostridium homopropionicum DSM 5847]|uniref:HTH-type transcriptional regulator YofA n=1 Tax=Clostridium homopropionicum DSM 5847 TaxID=1121318 RepID=A0A0L6Z532_9CLOT|nr:LysR substrate-binding domain-containing protein [Clostridium homopropionicum]KOA18072.1 HTH-type transcriptional regulator YofA [Clostridium homopropionicum DSM 5847]SFG71087.1 LysR substrate binding domain-containing protein [Clostridium homopropionicum]